MSWVSTWVSRYLGIYPIASRSYWEAAAVWSFESWFFFLGGGGCVVSYHVVSSIGGVDS